MFKGNDRRYNELTCCPRYGVNPLKCRKCGGKMRIMGFITHISETKRILKHLGEETKRDLPLRASMAKSDNQDTWLSDFIPPVEAYICDPQ
ncbi:MAG: hypothetical protein HY730_07440 [Candidatus Tectomicrobia bacterium]|uniref:Uncharacterized protein n=1 Tax=Tectimicrobiota bacterium TaxID=2528274 RepID=A0A933LRA9_UNCTE|nr:hypothetical protein [Candidatus Tectomicrobia bacterium]